MNTDGTTDVDFGQTGTVTLPSGFEQPGGVLAVDGDGKILIAGSVQHGSATDLAVMRLTRFGAVDASFGNDGVAVADGLPSEQGKVAFGYTSQPESLDVLNDGTILLAGVDGTFGKTQIFHQSGPTLVEFQKTGALNPAFGLGGQTSTYLSANGDSVGISGLIVQSDGTFVVAGSKGSPFPVGPDTSFSILRYASNGAVTGSISSQFIPHTVGEDVDFPISNLYDATGGRNGTVIIVGSIFTDFQTSDSVLARYITDAVVPDHRLVGTVIGSTGSYGGKGNVAAKAFDNNIGTFFDAKQASGNWTGLDLGVPQVVSRVAFVPRDGRADRMVGGVFQVSSNLSFSSDVHTVYAVNAVPTAGQLTTVSIASPGSYRFVRYLGPAGSYCNVADISFFGPSLPAGVNASDALIVNGTPGADNIAVDVSIESLEPGTQTVTTTVNGVVQVFDALKLKGIVINGGDGTDHIVTTGAIDGSLTSITGYDLATTINGSGGDDTILTTAAPVSVNFQLPPVVVNGGDGNDAISINQAGTVSVNGGNGDDSVFAFSEYTLYTTVDGGAGTNYFKDLSNHSFLGNDLIDLNGPAIRNIQDYFFGSGDQSAPNTTIQGTSGADHITVTGGRHVTVNGCGGADEINVSADVAEVDGGNQNDLILISVLNGGTVNGGAGDDRIYANIVAGNPTVEPVTIDGGPGLDTAYTVPGDTVTNVERVNPAASSLSGTPIGTPGSYYNSANTIAKAFDGDLTTYFDAPVPTGAWVGLDLGGEKIVRQVRFAPRPGYSGFADRMVGGQIQASDTADFSSGVVSEYTITTAPKSNTLTTVNLPNFGAYRYWRYLGPAGGSCNLAELEFDG